MEATKIDNQPISATFFHEGKWLTEFVTPNALEVEKLHGEITQGIDTLDERIAALRDWVATDVKYVKFVQGRVNIAGNISIQDDLWNDPSVTRRIRIGNCANKAFLLASLARRELSADQVYCVLGNLYNGKAGGHAWVEVILNGQEYILESTRADVPSLIPTFQTKRYEPVHYFNDQAVYTVEGKTVLTPFTACYSTWLKDYLDWAYIEGRK